ncbi:MAG: hypothetical protein ACO3EE_09360 [Flavobacteriales bacterium]
MNRFLLYLLIVFTVTFASCSERYYDDSVRTPRGGGNYRDSYSSYGYNKKKQKYLDSYSSKRVKKGGTFKDSYSTKSKSRGKKGYKDSYSTSSSSKRKIRFYDSLSSKRRKKNGSLFK